MKRMAAMLCLLVFAGCTTSPLGHPQLNLVSGGQMAQMGAEAYKQERQKTPISHNAALTRYVQCVAHAITGVAAPNKQWQVTLFQKDEANAWALPGGYIGVYTGLLKYARNQDQLGAVLGHEVSHVLAHHSAARVSAQMATQGAVDVLAILAGQQGGQNQRMLMTALGVGAQVGVLLPYSRQQETEADLLGLQLMARAGFDPRQAVQLWQNMAKAGQQPPVFLSDHPSRGTRIEDLQARMPQALADYRHARAAGRKPSCQAP